MSSTSSPSYLLIASEYRDRILYPFASDFVIPFQMHSQSMNLSVLNTTNPITAFPIYMFCWTNFSVREKEDPSP